MRIFGPLPWPTISPVTVTPARVCASLVTVSRSTTATLCCRPPAFTTAYTMGFLSTPRPTISCPARAPVRTTGARDEPSARQAAPRGARPGTEQPGQRTRAERRRSKRPRSLPDGRTGRTAGRPAAARPRRDARRRPVGDRHRLLLGRGNRLGRLLHVVR